MQKLFKMSTKNVIFDTTNSCNFYLILIADLCYNYQNLSDANTKRFFKKAVVSTSSTSFGCHLVVNHATVLQIECEANNSRKKRTRNLNLRYTYSRVFTKSSFYNNQSVHFFDRLVRYDNFRFRLHAAFASADNVSV